MSDYVIPDRVDMIVRNQQAKDEACVGPWEQEDVKYLGDWVVRVDDVVLEGTDQLDWLGTDC